MVGANGAVRLGSDADSGAASRAVNCGNSAFSVAL